METSAATARVARHPSKETPTRNAAALNVGQLYTGPTRRDYVEISGRGE